MISDVCLCDDITYCSLPTLDTWPDRDQSLGQQSDVFLPPPALKYFCWSLAWQVGSGQPGNQQPATLVVTLALSKEQVVMLSSYTLSDKDPMPPE